MSIHNNFMLSGDCNTCHISPHFPVYIDFSIGGIMLDPISCVGCHGRDEDIGNDSSSTGRGAGLRRHHFNAAVTLCIDCHSDADPANYTPVGEYKPPPYYSTPDVNHPAKPTNPCNP